MRQEEIEITKRMICSLYDAQAQAWKSAAGAAPGPRRRAGGKIKKIRFDVDRIMNMCYDTFNNHKNSLLIIIY